MQSNNELASDELMDVGTGGYVDVDKPTPITSFSAEAKNATNGLETTYYLTWSTVLRTLKNDRFYVEFPPETELIPTSSKSGSGGSSTAQALACTGLNGFASTGLQCEKDPAKPYRLIIRFAAAPLYPTGLFRMSVSKVRNPPSTRRSSQFVDIYHATSAE